MRTAEEYLAREGALVVHTRVLDEPANRAFAARRGYAASRPAHFLHLDLAHSTLPQPPEIPAGAELRTAAEFAGDPHPLFEADAEATADEPSDIPAELSDYEDWLNTTWRRPSFDRALTSIVVVDGTVAAFSAAITDGLTATRRG